jgi:uncharacterized protein
MLVLRPNCEWCKKVLPPDSLEAYICSYECTFCADCVENLLSNVCPNCGGGFCQRPVRPQHAHRPGVGLAHHPASDKEVVTSYSRNEITDFANKIAHLAPRVR